MKEWGNILCSRVHGLWDLEKLRTLAVGLEKILGLPARGGAGGSPILGF